MLDTLLAELRDVDEPCRLDTDVDEDAEVRDVAHRAAHDGAGLDVGELDDRLARQGCGQIFARVAPGLFERVNDVAHRRHARVELARELFGVGERELRSEQAERLLVLEVGEGEAEAREQLFGEIVGFGVHGCVVEGALAARDAQEARALREGGRPEARDLQELSAALEDAVFVAPADDVLRDRLRDARDVREERRRRRVEVHAYMVHGGLHRSVERGGKLLLVHVVLILTDADRLRLDFHELGERILHAPRDGDGAADRHVVVGQLLLRELRGGVDGGACLVRDEVVDGELVLADEVRRELLRLVGCRAVADGNERHAVLPDEREHLLRRI